jgi:23S rRNA (cytidine1920-2'-O)/16S rRNA (cytidine1409-2'-O)-methyltransferase
MSKKDCTAKIRVDKLLTNQGLARSRTHAQALIMAGQVCLGDYLVKKSSEEFPPGSIFRLKDGVMARFVSRGGEKLQGVLTELNLDVTGLRALDIGISTGGFTDCLLQNGVASVVGLDVGHNQLDWKIRNDLRVKAFEGINGRDIPKGLFNGLFDIVVIDVSFISLTYILPSAFKVLKKEGVLLALIKPQFEVKKEQVGKGGIIKDPLLHGEVQEKITKFCESAGLTEIRTFLSVIEGTDGNKEFFIFGKYVGRS